MAGREPAVGRCRAAAPSQACLIKRLGVAV